LSFFKPFQETLLLEVLTQHHQQVGRLLKSIELSMKVSGTEGRAKEKCSRPGVSGGPYCCMG